MILPYKPHKKQLLVHKSPSRFRVIGAGRRFGKTVLAINELLYNALLHPNRRSWYIAPTYQQAENIVWRDPRSGIFKWIPPELIRKRRENDLYIELVNGHIIELKGSDKYDSLRGVGLVFVVLDEYGFMKMEVWEGIIRPMLSDEHGKALFIGTPADHGGQHFKDLWDRGQGIDPNYESWLFKTIDNTELPGLKEEVEEARLTMPEDLFKREYEADFSMSQGLCYPEFNYGIHTIDSYRLQQDDVLVGSIDPGMRVPTACLWSAWNTREETGVFFDEFYIPNLVAEEAAQRILAQNGGKQVRYWVIDKSSKRRDFTSSLTVFGEYKKFFPNLYEGPDSKDDIQVRGQINKVKTLLHVDPRINRPRIRFTRNLVHTIEEIRHYQWYEYKYGDQRNPKEMPKKYKDHLMDCMKNTIATRPWERKFFGPKFYTNKH